MSHDLPHFAPRRNSAKGNALGCPSLSPVSPAGRHQPLPNPSRPHPGAKSQRFRADAMPLVPFERQKGVSIGPAGRRLARFSGTISMLFSTSLPQIASNLVTKTYQAPKIRGTEIIEDFLIEAETAGGGSPDFLVRKTYQVWEFGLVTSDGA